MEPPRFRVDGRESSLGGPPGIRAANSSGSSRCPCCVRNSSSIRTRCLKAGLGGWMQFCSSSHVSTPDSVGRVSSTCEESGHGRDRRGPRRSGARDQRLTRALPDRDQQPKPPNLRNQPRYDGRLGQVIPAELPLVAKAASSRVPTSSGWGRQGRKPSSSVTEALMT